MYAKLPVFLRGSDAVAVILALALVFFMAGGRLSRPEAATGLSVLSEFVDFQNITLAAVDEA